MKRRLGATFLESPRDRRLRKDLREMEQLREDSTIMDFEALGDPPDKYRILFQGPGLVEEGGQLVPSAPHELEISLGAQYPRALPNIRWLTPIRHPNIMAGNQPCLGSYTFTPRQKLTDLVELLWDLQRMAIFGPEIRGWDPRLKGVELPLDPRVLRDRVEAPACPVETPEGVEDVFIIEGHKPRMGIMAPENIFGVCLAIHQRQDNQLRIIALIRNELTRMQLILKIDIDAKGELDFINPLICDGGAGTFEEARSRFEATLIQDTYQMLCVTDLFLEDLSPFLLQHVEDPPAPALDEILDMVEECLLDVKKSP